MPGDELDSGKVLTCRLTSRDPGIRKYAGSTCAPGDLESKHILGRILQLACTCLSPRRVIHIRDSLNARGRSAWTVRDSNRAAPMHNRREWSPEGNEVDTPPSDVSPDSVLATSPDVSMAAGPLPAQSPSQLPPLETVIVVAPLPPESFPTDTVVAHMSPSSIATFARVKEGMEVTPPAAIPPPAAAAAAASDSLVLSAAAPPPLAPLNGHGSAGAANRPRELGCSPSPEPLSSNTDPPAPDPPRSTGANSASAREFCSFVTLYLRT